MAYPHPLDLEILQVSASIQKFYVRLLLKEKEAIIEK